MLNGQVREQPVTEEALGEHSGRSSRKGAVAVLAVTLLQFVADDFLSYGVYLDNRTGFTALGIQRTTAVRTAPWSSHRFLAGDLLLWDLAAAMAGMTWLGAAPALPAFRRCVGFDGVLGRGRGRAKGSLFSVALLVAQAGFKANDFFLQPINDPLLFQTTRAIAGWEFRR
jgi:hypothetical protein